MISEISISVSNAWIIFVCLILKIIPSIADKDKNIEIKNVTTSFKYSICTKICPKMFLSNFISFGFNYLFWLVGTFCLPTKKSTFSFPNWSALSTLPFYFRQDCYPIWNIIQYIKPRYFKYIIKFSKVSTAIIKCFFFVYQYLISFHNFLFIFFL